MGPRWAMAIDAGRGNQGVAVAGFAFNEEIFPTQQNDFLLKGSERHFHTYMILFIFWLERKTCT